MQGIWLRACALWFAILLLAMLNGLLREKVLIPAAGSAVGLVASGILLSGCVFLVAFLATPWFGALRSSQWLLIGLFWLVLTLVFELSFGRFIEHKSWPELFEAYTFKEGNLWPLVLVATLFSPWAAAKTRGVIWADESKNRPRTPKRRDEPQPPPDKSK